jgi:phosphoenolpyruvate carboxykinase (GTP)
MWPGYGENLRVLRWIADRCEGKVGATETPIGYLPRSEDLDVRGLNLDSTTLQTLLSIEPAAWRQEIESIGKYLDEYKDRVPDSLRKQQKDVAKKLTNVA